MVPQTVSAALLVVLALAAQASAAEPPARAPDLVVVVDATYNLSHGYGHMFKCTVKRVEKGTLADRQIHLSTIAFPKERYGGALQEFQTYPDLRLSFARIPARPAALSGFVDGSGAVWEILSAVPSPGIPEHLRRFPGLYVRDGEKIVDAPAADVEVAKRYPAFEDKGPVRKGIRITLLTAKLKVAAKEEVRVIHVLEAVEPGHDVYAMGPKFVFEEYVDGALATRRWEGPGVYDGAVLKSPSADFNYEITSYRFAKPGRHTIVWKGGDPSGESVGLSSNPLTIDVQ
jgi:hypothetical protein